MLGPRFRKFRAFENDPISEKFHNQQGCSRKHFPTNVDATLLKHGNGCCQKGSIIISYHKDVQSSFRLKIFFHFFVLRERTVTNMKILSFTMGMTFFSIFEKSAAIEIQSSLKPRSIAKVIGCNDKTGIKWGVN